MAAKAAGRAVIGRAACLTLVLVFAACRDEPEQPRGGSPASIAPIGTGTELLLTRERLALLEDWIRAAIVREGTVPMSLDAVRPPPGDEARYVPLDRFMRDGWGREIVFQFMPQNGSYELRSPGADGTLHTDDDVLMTQRVSG